MIRPCAIVTGASSGIGRATAVLLNERGWAVVAVGRDVARLEETRSSCVSPEAVKVRVADVVDAAAMEDVATATLEVHDGIDALVTAAAVSRCGFVDDMPMADWRLTVETSLYGTYHACRAVLPAMRGAGRGTIVTFSSVLAHATLPGFAAYSAAKAGVEALTRAIALDHAREGIRANCLVSGSADTPMMWDGVLPHDVAAVRRDASQEQPLGRVADPSEVARVVAFLLSEEASFVSGASLVVDGALLTRLASHEWVDRYFGGGS